jgi:hypothetical protein
MANVAVSLLVEEVKQRRAGDEPKSIHKVFAHLIVRRQSASETVGG